MPLLWKQASFQAQNSIDKDKSKMNYKAEIRIFGDAEKICKCFLAELRKDSSERSSCKIKKEKEYVLFEIESKDSVSLRASLNAVTKLFTVYEQIKEIK